jgi:hypothetical protein
MRKTQRPNPGSELVRKRWERTTPKERSAIASEIVNARWKKWRAENPEKAAASEARRAKRAAAAKKAAKKKRST